MALPTLRIIGFILGLFLITLAIGMVLPILTLLIHEHSHEIESFTWASMITLSAGVALILPGRPEQIHLRPRDMYLLTTASWVVVCVFAALPLNLLQNISYTDAFFEAMSGITTTGSTVLSGLDSASPGLLMWRSMLHWLGGIGFIGMAVAILPLLRVGGMRLFQTESSDWSEKVMPRSHMVAKYIVGIYVGFTLLGILAFHLAGMGWFDAINHSMSAISTEASPPRTPRWPSSARPRTGQPSFSCYSAACPSPSMSPPCAATTRPCSKTTRCAASWGC
ncbi:TrkH family potassium uptake protein [Azotobacter sp. CWF10]